MTRLDYLTVHLRPVAKTGYTDQTHVAGQRFQRKSYRRKNLATASVRVRTWSVS